jgi:hypothetical protein
MYGKTASGSVIVTTKSADKPSSTENGYGFLRNELFNSRNYFDAAQAAPRFTAAKITAGPSAGRSIIPNVYNKARRQNIFLLF